MKRRGSKAGLSNLLQLEPRSGWRKINTTTVALTCRLQPGAHQDVMFIKVQWKWEMLALNNLDKGTGVDKLVHYSFLLGFQTDKQTKKSSPLMDGG